MTSLYDMCRGPRCVTTSASTPIPGLVVLIPNPVFSPRVCAKNLKLILKMVCLEVCSIPCHQKDESLSCHDIDCDIYDKLEDVSSLIVLGNQRQITAS